MAGSLLQRLRRIERIEHIYTPAEVKSRRPGEARLTKAVAVVSSLH